MAVMAVARRPHRLTQPSITNNGNPKKEMFPSSRSLTLRKIDWALAADCRQPLNIVVSISYIILLTELVKVLRCGPGISSQEDPTRQPLERQG